RARDAGGAGPRRPRVKPSLEVPSTGADPVRAPPEELRLEDPRRAAVGRAFAAPGDRVGRDVDERPADQRAVRAPAVLHDLVADTPADEVVLRAGHGVDPDDPPRTGHRVVHTD